MNDINSKNNLNSQKELGKIRPYSNDMQIAEVEGTRIAKFLYKADRNGDKKVENSFVRLPTNHLDRTTIEENLDTLFPYIQRWLFSVETAMIKDNHKKGGYTNVSCEHLTATGLAEYLERTQPLFKLDKVLIENWFNSLIAGTISYKLDKKGIDSKKQQPFIAKYRNMFLSCLLPKTILTEDNGFRLATLIEETEQQNTSIGVQMLALISDCVDREEEELPDLDF